MELSNILFDNKENCLQPIKELNSELIWSITTLKNGRLISDNKRQIFFHNKKNYDLKIAYRDKMELTTVSNFTELAESIFCFCEEDLYKDTYCIKIIQLKYTKKNNIPSFEEIQIIKLGKSNINKIIRINKNTFAGSSNDRTIKIWELNKKNKKYNLKTKIKINDYIGNDFNNMIPINKKTIVYYSKTYGKKLNKVIIFLNIIKGKIIKVIHDIECLTGKNSMILVKKRILIVCALDGVYAIDIQTYNILINSKLSGYESSVFNFREGFLVFNRDDEEKKNEYFLKEYTIEKDNNIKLKKNLLYIDEKKNKINDIIQKDNNTLIILDEYGKITFWKYP